MVPGGNFTQQLLDPKNEGGITFEMELMLPQRLDLGD